MEKQKRWQLFLILAVVLLTIYNVLPTLFYYAQPLKKPIGPKEAQTVVKDIVQRVNGLEAFTLSWLKAQSKNLGLKPLAITLDPENPRLAKVTFRKAQEAQFFSQTLLRAGSLIPFVPAQLSPHMATPGEEATTVVVQRQVGVHFDPAHPETYFRFVSKRTPEGALHSEYQQLVYDRLSALALGFGGESAPARLLVDNAMGKASDEEMIRLARRMVEYDQTFPETSAIKARYFASFTQTDAAIDRGELVQKFVARLEQMGHTLRTAVTKTQEEQKARQDEGKFLDVQQQQKVEVFENQRAVVESAAALVRRNPALFARGAAPLTREALLHALADADKGAEIQKIAVGLRNPFVDYLEMDWRNDQVALVLHEEVRALREQAGKSELEAMKQEKLNQLLFHEMAATSQKTDETITPSLARFVVLLNTLNSSSSLLTLDLAALAQQQAGLLRSLLQAQRQAGAGDLAAEAYPVSLFETREKLSSPDQKFGLVVYAPVLDPAPSEGFRTSSLYVIARGLPLIQQKYRSLPDGVEKAQFEQSLQAFYAFMRQNGFISYSAQAANLPALYKDDYIFELDDYYAYLLAATREAFSIKGSKRYAVLEFTDVDQRILTLNKILTRTHEDLLKWRDEYRQAHVSIDPKARYDVPAPTRNVLWDNVRLSLFKYFHGDERKILKWGLDLSGGKTVRIGLRDQQNRPITNESDVKHAVNELYRRVNRLGVSEVGIRTEGSVIVLDFPGSQGLAASELIQASAMQFHVVNEKFTANNPTLGEAVNAFLEEVWNEAVITNRTDPAQLNEIAWQHLGGNADNPDEFHPITSHAQLLYEHGLRFAGPHAPGSSSAFDDGLSAISLFRASEPSGWFGQTYPLLIVFRNYALEGANLDNVQTGYTPTEGNTLYFGVKGSAVSTMGERSNPRDDFYTWTSQFSEEKIAGTPKESYSRGHGWRMAVVLNGSIISAPQLNSPLRENARITGHFSQREINQLAADLKAGSLSFVPHILSEENVSPDLGKEQRTQGIFAAGLGLLLVLVAMCAYYRFSGVIASVAVLFNLLIIWAVLQNLGAALTLPGIAGIILAIGMSVDANVLVFERIREEFAVTRRLPSAIAAGYRKAFSAIVDSNLTTIIAAVILLNFDSGPVKGFALTLIIGIISSMFTALFVTRFFFAGWVQNPLHKELKMAQLFGKTTIDFLSKARVAIALSLIVMAIGGVALIKERKTIFGMDFTGGYALTLELQEQPHVSNYRLLVEHALVKAGAIPSDFHIKELNSPNRLHVQLGMGMEQEGRPFYHLEEVHEDVLLPYQSNPQIVWIVSALAKEGIQIAPTFLPDLHLYWNEMSGQLSETMRNQAILGLGLALLCILIYITFRFEFNYAISATLGLAHDLLITLGLLALCHLFYEGIQIDLQVIAALMTIVGYSLNDTIIIFDRIREDLRMRRKVSLSEVINHALNATLSRTVMTSGTTLLVLVALVLLGGASIFSFALIMTIGVAVGTLSSLYIAAPLLLYFRQRELQKEKHPTMQGNGVT